MTRLDYSALHQLDLVAPGGLPFGAVIPIDEVTDYSTWKAFFNVGVPQDQETALLLGTTAGGQCVATETGLFVVTLSQNEMLSLPRRPCPYVAWIETASGDETIHVAEGVLAVQPTVGAAGLAPDPGDVPPEVVDGGAP